ncbi:AzlD domain-containing protein [Actibacterium pelagium]|uniref:Membrane protein n=1 Tax=Actibacterium pelagium TaxID=2029103 RepID=A0A917AHF4_9RHOB|nr:AzlD domain-containing protein [Actibacterium pelagium]GGE54025.1 membrane protein [Actibacterium pelagium]
MSQSSTEIWMAIAALGLGTFLLRFSFLGILGKRELPDWVLRHLRYTPVAVLPGLIAPLVLWPAATDGQPDPARLLAAGVTLLIGVLTHNAVIAICSGAATLYSALYLLG